jgi:hypothetical protein
LPAALGEFDIAVMEAVLLHCRDPLRIVQECAKRAKLLIIVDKFHAELEGPPVSCLAPHGGISARNFFRKFSP